MISAITDWFSIEEADITLLKNTPAALAGTYRTESDPGGWNGKKCKLSQFEI